VKIDFYYDLFATSAMGILIHRKDVKSTKPLKNHFM